MKNVFRFYPLPWRPSLREACFYLPSPPLPHRQNSHSNEIPVENISERSNPGSQLGSNNANTTGAIIITSGQTSTSTSAKVKAKANVSGTLTISFGGPAGTYYFGTVTLVKAGQTIYFWTGEEQAASYIAYLKTFVGSCASGEAFASRDEVARLVEEYNAMIEEAKSDGAFLESFMDNGFQTNALEKLMTMVEQYNESLQHGESALSLEEAPAQAHSIISHYGGENSHSTFILEFVIALALALASLHGFAFMRRKNNKE